MKKIVIILAIVLLPIYAICEPAERGGSSYYAPFSLGIFPLFSMPIGEATDTFNYGLGVQVLGLFAWRSIPWFNLIGSIGYDYMTVESETSVSSFSFGLGVGTNLRLSSKVYLVFDLTGGYFYGFLNDKTAADPDEVTSGGNPYYSAGAGLSFRISPSVSIGLGSSYRDYLGFKKDITFSIGTTYHFRPLSTRVGEDIGPTPLKSLKIRDIEMDTIYPVL